MTATDDILARAARNAGSGERLTARPALGVAVVTCMDARIDPFGLFGFTRGDAHVVRNAGGIVTDDVLRSLALSQHELGTHEILVVAHTECGLLGLDDDAFADKLAKATGVRPTWRAGGFDDAAASVRRSLALLTSSRFLAATTSARGFVYDVNSGVLDEVTGS